MTLFQDKKASAEDTQRSSFRVRHVGTKLSVEELRNLESLVSQRGTTQGEFIRDLILAEIAKKTPRKPDPMLSEIVGIRMLLVNLLQPRDDQEPLTRESFEMLLGEIKRMKKQIALDIERENGRR
jgi:hypothetical protein